LQESRAGRSIRRSLDGAPISFAAEQRLLASDPQSAQSEARSRRLLAGSYAAFIGGFGLLATMPLLGATTGQTQRDLIPLVAAAPVGWGLGLILTSYVDEAHHDAIAWFNAAARGAHHCPP
jgi:hypothetical protein